MAPNAGHRRTIPVAKSPSHQQSEDRSSLTPQCRLAALRPLLRGPYRLHFISPSTTVAIGPPWNVLPWKGEFRLREAD